MESAIYKGDVFHQRLSPKRHSFRYRMSMMYFDTDELDQIQSRSFWCGSRWYHPLRFKRSDFHGDSSRTIKEAVQASVNEQLGIKLDGPVRVLGHWRFMGFNFNPLTTYYCFDSDGVELKAVLAEVTNTPWLERKAYALKVEANNPKLEFEKNFTVSPFSPINMYYRWYSSKPGANLIIQIRSYHEQKHDFSANLSLERIELDAKSISSMARAISVSAYSVVFSIYWQALKLVIKGVPFLGKDKVRAS